MKKGTFYITQGFYRFRKTFSLMEILFLCLDFSIWQTKKNEKRDFLHYLGGFKVKKNFFIYENFYIFAQAYFLILKDGRPKIVRISFLHGLGVFKVKEKVFKYDNFHCFTLAYSPIFQYGGTKNMKRVSILPKGFRS